MNHNGLEPNTITYNAVISACEKGEWPEKALELLEEMQHNGLEPDMITYSVVISACEKKKWPKKALQLLEEMKRNGLEPDLITHTAAMNGNVPEPRAETRVKCVPVDRLASTAPFSARVRETHTLKRNTLVGLRRSRMQVAVSISACQQGTRHQKASRKNNSRLCAIHRGPGNKSRWFHWCKGNIDTATRWLHWLCDAQHHFDDKTYSAIIRAITACAEQGEIDGAEHWLRRMRNAGLKLDEATCNSALHSFTLEPRVSRGARHPPRLFPPAPRLPCTFPCASPHPFASTRTPRTHPAPTHTPTLRTRI